MGIDSWASKFLALNRSASAVLKWLDNMIFLGTLSVRVRSGVNFSSHATDDKENSPSSKEKAVKQD